MPVVCSEAISLCYLQHLKVLILSYFPSTTFVIYKSFFYCHCDKRSACKAGALFATAACAPRAIARQGMHAP